MAMVSVHVSNRDVILRSGCRIVPDTVKNPMVIGVQLFASSVTNNAIDVVMNDTKHATTAKYEGTSMDAQ